MSKRLLNESNAPFFSKVVIEKVETTVGDRMRVRGVFSAPDLVNENKRSYPLNVWERNLGEGSALMERIGQRCVFGEMEHPDSGTTHLARVSHLIEKAWLADLPADNPYGVAEGKWVIGEAMIFNTPNGLILQELHACGCPVGISSRGRGDVVPNADGVDVVQENYDCETWDFVADPSVIQARPTPVRESIDVTDDQEIRKIIERMAEVCDTVKIVGDKEIIELVEAGALIGDMFETLHKSKIMGDARTRAMSEARSTVSRICEQIKQKTGAVRIFSQTRTPAAAVKPTTESRNTTVKLNAKKTLQVIETLGKQVADLTARLATAKTGESKKIAARLEQLQTRYDKLVEAADILLKKARTYKQESMENKRRYEASVVAGEALREAYKKLQGEKNLAPVEEMDDTCKKCDKAKKDCTCKTETGAITKPKTEGTERPGLADVRKRLAEKREAAKAAADKKKRVEESAKPRRRNVSSRTAEPKVEKVHDPVGSKTPTKVTESTRPKTLIGLVAERCDVDDDR